MDALLVTEDIGGERDYGSIGGSKECVKIHMTIAYRGYCDHLFTI